MFRSLAAAALVALHALPAQATEELSPDQLCKRVHDQAWAFMTARQLEAPITKIMGTLDGQQELARTMILDAYDQPAFATKRMQERAAQAFANEWATKCYAGTLAE